MTLYDSVALLGLTRGASIPQQLMLPVIGCFDDFTNGQPSRFHKNANVATLTFSPGTGDSTASLAADAGLGEWFVGGTNSVTGTLVSNSMRIITAAALSGGWVKMITGSTSGDEASAVHYSAPVQWSVSETEPIAFTFRTRVLFQTITATDQILGVGSTNNATPVTIQTASSFDFRIVNGVVNYQFQTSATTVTAAPLFYVDSGLPVTVAASASIPHVFQMEWDGLNKMALYMDGKPLRPAGLVPYVKVPTFTLSDISAHLGINTSSAATKDMDCDYIILIGDCPKAGR